MRIESYDQFKAFQSEAKQREDALKKKVLVCCGTGCLATGAKEVAEGPMVTTAQTIANAVSNAIGRPINEIPITPERILRILKQKNQD